MGTKYTTEAITGYNASPPVDDGTQSEANKTKWATHIDKIGDPLKDQVANIDTKLVAMADVGPDAKIANYTTVAGDHQKTIEVDTASVVITLLSVTTAPAGYTVIVKNSSGGLITVDATAAELIDGSATAITLQDNEAGTFQLNSDETEYISLQQVLATGNAGLSSDNIFTGANTFTGANAFTGNNTFDNGVAAPINSITGTVLTNALTVGLNPCPLDFRSATLTDGTKATVLVGSALSLVVPSTATLGTVSAVQSRLILLAINNAGTVELAIVNQSGGNNLDETTLISTTAIDATADSDNVIYSTTARTSVAFRVVGYIESTQATAGTWATAPSTLQGAGGNALTAMGSVGYGQTWQDVSGSRTSGTTYYNTTGKPIVVSASASGTTSGITIAVDGVTVIRNLNGAATSAVWGANAIIPPGSSYVATIVGALDTWAELR